MGLHAILNHVLVPLFVGARQSHCPYGFDEAIREIWWNFPL
jgi:hypothetical protein